MDERTREILKLKENLEKEKAKQAKNEGKLEHVLQELKELGYNDLKEAEKQLKKLTKEIDEKKEELQSMIDDYEEKYDI